MNNNVIVNIIEASDSGNDIAVFPLAMPLIASPQGIVILITFAAAFEQGGRSIHTLYIALAITMVINLLALLFGSRIACLFESDFSRAKAKEAATAFT